MSVKVLSDFLDTYDGRDKILKTLTYVAKLTSGFVESENASAKLQLFGSEMSNCRVVLRLFDDIPTLHYALTYGSRKKDSYWLVRWVELVEVLLSVISGPIEHICWAGNRKIISIDTKKWDLATTWLWLATLYLALTKSVCRFKQLKKQESRGFSIKESTPNTLEEIRVRRSNELLTCIRLALDLSYAVHYLPPGILWGGKLKTWQVGALGTISSVIALYQTFSRQ